MKGTRMRKGVPSASGMFACVSKWDADKLRCGGCSCGLSKAGVDAWSSSRGSWLRVVPGMMDTELTMIDGKSFSHRTSGREHER